jgi:hypothetical protein
LPAAFFSRRSISRGFDAQPRFAYVIKPLNWRKNTYEVFMVTAKYHRTVTLQLGPLP